MRWTCVVAMFLLPPAVAEIRDVIKSGDIDAAFARLEEARVMHDGGAYQVVFRSLAGSTGRAGRGEADEVWFVRRGTAELSLGEPAAKHRLGAGDVVHVPRDAAWRVEAEKVRLEYIAVRVIPPGGPVNPAWRKFYTPRRMPDVLKNADIEATFARFDSNQPLHAAANFTVNYVIYSGRGGPWEAHRGCVDIYFVRTGTAEARLGGTITNPKEDTPGEIRGDGVTGARRYTIGPGDLVLIPRNGAHHMDPGSGKFGYLLLKVWAE